MRKYIGILLVLLTLTSCKSVSTLIKSSYTGLPTWVISPPEEDGFIYIVGSDTDQSSDAALIDALREVSTLLGYDVTGRYYRELSTLGSIADLDLTIVQKKDVEGSTYILCRLSLSSVEKLRSEEYKIELDRKQRIESYILSAREYYRSNNDVAAVKYYLMAATMLQEGDAYLKEDVVKKAYDILRALKITISNEDKESGKCRVTVYRDKGLFSPRVVYAPISVTIKLHDHKDEYYEYTYKLLTDETGSYDFEKIYYKMSNVGSVIFSLDIDEDLLTLLPAKVNSNAIFTYDIKKEINDGEIIAIFNEYDESGDLLESTYARDAFEKYLIKENLKINYSAIVGLEVEEAVDIVKKLYPNARLLIFSQVGVDTLYYSLREDYVSASQGYTLIYDLISDEILYYDYNSRSSCYTKNKDDLYKTLYTDYGTIIASQFAHFL